jgi:septal ring factor EnvC (AmiA/AmiB activator)
LTGQAAATQAALDAAAAELQRTRAEATDQIERLTADLASSRSALEQDRADLASAHRRIEALEPEVFRLRESLARQLRVNTRTAADAAAQLADEKRRAAGAAWARESLVQRLNHALERR